VKLRSLAFAAVPMIVLAQCGPACAPVDQPEPAAVESLRKPPRTTTTTTTTSPPATTSPATTTTAPATTTPVDHITVPPTTAAPTTTVHDHEGCDVPMDTPYGALPPAMPMLCDEMAAGVASTATSGPNSWLDDFNHGASMAAMSPDYKVFDNVGTARSSHFRHNNHWMVDVFSPGGIGGGMMRPDRSFRFQDGKLVVETDVAAGIDEYRDMWPELTVTTASSPHGVPAYGPTPGKSVGDSLYAYGYFGGYDTIGIRLHTQRPIMAYYDSTERGFSCGRVWEFSWFQDGSSPGGECPHPAQATIYGGGEWVTDAWRRCVGTDPDINCRDRFRWELSRDQITLYVNGVKFMEHTALDGYDLVPEALLNGDVYVYLSDWIYQGPSDRVTRYHWDRVAVNP
jgi:hypothetical protein